MKLLYETEEKVLDTRENVKEFLKENLALPVETTEDEELKEFYTAEINFLLEEIYGEYMINAQGEDVVAGVRTPKPFKELKNDMPEIYEQFVEMANKLEEHFE